MLVPMAMQRPKTTNTTFDEFAILERTTTIKLLKRKIKSTSCAESDLIEIQ
jgi:hypothetical protein